MVIIEQCKSWELLRPVILFLLDPVGQQPRLDPLGEKRSRVLSVFLKIAASV
jgi:hypothetical protein